MGSPRILVPLRPTGSLVSLVSPVSLALPGAALPIAAADWHVPAMAVYSSARGAATPGRRRDDAIGRPTRA